MIKKSIILSTLFLCVNSVFANSHEAQISEGIDVFATVTRELDMYYADTLNIKDLMTKGVKGMLSSIDPYTVYIPEQGQKDFKFMTTGEYAGVGSVITKRDEDIYITEVYEGTPSHKAGLKVGDVILKVDTFDCKNASVSDVSNHLRGIASTEAKVKIRAAADGKEKTISIIRDNITISSIPVSKMISQKTGIIRITSFTKGVAAEFKTEFLKLKKQGMERLVIDLRDNPGGILSEAVSIVSMFVDKGEKIVYTKPKLSAWAETYTSQTEPLDLQIPILVMVDEGSASASEVVSGALQDLDRAVIMGERTYGKGLVQTTRDLPYGGSLKLTISKYHIPSGRCIQAIDYANRDKNGTPERIPDSLTTEFKTKNGRIVRDGCGILPDVNFKKKDGSEISYHLYVKNIIFDYVTQYEKTHSVAPKSVDQFEYKDWDEFKIFVQNSDFSYKTVPEEYLKKLIEVAKKDSVYDGAEKEFQALELALSHCQDLELEKAKEDIIGLITYEYIKRVLYQRGAAESELKYDSMVKVAIEVIEDDAKIKEILKK